MWRLVFWLEEERSSSIHFCTCSFPASVVCFGDWMDRSLLLFVRECSSNWRKMGADASGTACLCGGGEWPWSSLVLLLLHFPCKASVSVWKQAVVWSKILVRHFAKRGHLCLIETAFEKRSHVSFKMDPEFNWLNRSPTFFPPFLCVQDERRCRLLLWNSVRWIYRRLMGAGEKMLRVHSGVSSSSSNNP